MKRTYGSGYSCSNYLIPGSGIADQGRDAAQRDTAHFDENSLLIGASLGRFFDCDTELSAIDVKYQW